MKRGLWRFAGLALAIALPVTGAHAQLDGLLKKGAHGAEMKGMGGLAGGAMTSGSMGNVAGLLQYCMGNNYLSADSAGSVKDKLMGKLPGGAPTQDPAYKDGAKGVLHASNGSVMDLGGSASAGMEADVAKKACDAFLAQAKSLL